MDKLTIVFAMQYEAGHMLCTFNLAKKLQARGHDIVYLSAPDFEEMIVCQGFRTISFAEDLLPPGYAAKTFSSSRERRRHDASIYAQYVKRITDGTLDACILSVKPDLVICDPFMSYVAIRALYLGVPAMHLFSSLFLYENPDIPPVVSGRRPTSRLRTLLAWKLMFMKFLFVKRLKNMVTGEFRFPTRMHHLVSAYFQVAKDSGYPCVKNKTYRLNEIGFNLVLPEFMLCPKAFQFPGDIPKERMYIGDFVDFERKETPLDFELDGRPLIYCSLGTAAATYPHAERFYRAVAEASAMRRDWQFVLQISDQGKIGRYASTENLRVLNWAPQLHILKKAAATVTHGGLNTIMESVGLGTPMVIVPGMRDQPGNAARAAYHNIALTTGMKDIEGAALVGLICKAMVSREIKAGLERMKDRIDREDGLTRSVGFIESYAGTKKAAGAGGAPV